MTESYEERDDRANRDWEADEPSGDHHQRRENGVDEEHGNYDDLSPSKMNPEAQERDHSHELHHERGDGRDDDREGVDKIEQGDEEGEIEHDRQNHSDGEVEKDEVRNGTHAHDTEGVKGNDDADRDKVEGREEDKAQIVRDEKTDAANGATGVERDNEKPSGELVNLFVRNVAKHVSEEQLVELFSKYGKVDSAVVVRDPHSKECRGFGFVKMYNEEEAMKTIETFQDYEFEGRRISVEKAKRKAPHSRTPGAYMGIDRRIRDRYTGMKRYREYETTGYGYNYGYSGYGDPYGMPRRGGYRGGRYGDDGRARYDNRGGWDGRMHMRTAYDDRERLRRRYDEPRNDRNLEREQRYREREPPVPREPTDEFV